ncbi:PP2C family protein-serine/threonine phosphatase [Streptomyces sp. NPDC052299]|uniref:PP2C family protein-serine/threonine phosphatase n=1 Tax=Streptomyces sp. NPDC052299 TaxID=3155054 RepID=UPI0034382966
MAQYAENRRRALLAVPVGWIIAVFLVDVLAPPDIHLGPLLVAAPAITPSIGGPRAVGFVAALAVVAQMAIAVLRDPDELFSANHETQTVALALVGVCLVVFCVLRERRARELDQVRYVSEAVQRAVLPPLPRRLGPLRVASLYLAAEAEAQIGGDLYAAARTDTGTRLIIGDVRGKGVSAVSDAALLLGAFHAAARDRASLDELVAHLDESVSRGLPEPDGNGPGESFITATVLDIPDRHDLVHMVSCGHPPPVVLRGGRPLTVVAASPAPPLGLGGLSHPRYHVDSFRFAPGDLLLLYTDGVTEARDASRAFYPLAERVTGWAEDDPDAFIDRFRDDLLRYVGGHLDDDAAMIAIGHGAGPGA